MTTTEPPSSTEPPPPASSEPEKDEHRYNPYFVHTPRSERKLLEQQDKFPVGPRRRRAAMATSNNIPFSQLPYHCFQEARKVLQEDRAQKVEEINTMRTRISNLEARAVELKGMETEKETVERQNRLRSMRNRLEAWKILADINDPLVKKNFEDGTGMIITFETLMAEY
jgi:large subunit ribosomal protein L35